MKPEALKSIKSPVNELRQQAFRIIDSQAMGYGGNHVTFELPTQLFTKGTLKPNLLEDPSQKYPIPLNPKDVMRVTLARDGEFDDRFSARLEVFPRSNEQAWRLGVFVDSLGNISYQRGLISNRPVEKDGIEELVRILRYEEQLTELRSLLTGRSKGELEKVEHALLGVEIHQGGDERASGEHILVHAIEPVRILLEAGITDIDILTAAIGHDIAEDSREWRQKELPNQEKIPENERLFEPISPWKNSVKAKLEQEVGPDSAELIIGVTRIKPDGIEVFTSKHADYVYISSVAEDVRRVLVKMGDRTHNLETISAMPVKKQINTIIETIEYWKVFASYLHHPTYGQSIRFLLNRQFNDIKHLANVYKIPLPDNFNWLYQPKHLA